MDDSFSEILKHLEFHGPNSSDIRLFVISIIVYVVLILATVLVYAYVRGQRERKALLKAARSKGLSSAELDLVKKLAGKRSKVDLRHVFSSIREFHRLFGPRMHELVAASERDENARGMLDGIFTLRKKLFGDVSYHFGSLTSTIQIRIGQRITIRFEFQDSQLDFNSVVLDVDSEAITVANPSNEDAYFMLEKGQKVKVSFNRPEDGFYEFETLTLRAVSKDSQFFLLLAHADKIQRMQSRMYYRVIARIEVEINRFAWDKNPQQRFHPGKTDPGEKMMAHVINLGGGGALLRTEGTLKKNDLVAFDLPLTEDVRMDDVLGKVVEVVPGKDERDFMDVHVQFLNLKGSDKDTIMRVIQQRKLIEAE
jgi:c-di-GMP-binding flagellar brake protein YcgR